jgi:hypothetical protein
LMLSRGEPVGISPTIVARLMTVVSCRKKSSAVSVSTLPALGRWESAPSWPFGLPVSKKNVFARRGAARHTVRANASPLTLTLLACDKKLLNLFIVLSFQLNFSIVRSSDEVSAAAQAES